MLKDPVRIRSHLFDAVALFPCFASGLPSRFSNVYHLASRGLHFFQLGLMCMLLHCVASLRMVAVASAFKVAFIFYRASWDAIV